jgi:hypothetical protein
MNGAAPDLRMDGHPAAHASSVIGSGGITAKLGE